MGKLIDMKEWKAKQEYADMSECTNCKAPVINTGDGLRFNEEKYLDFLYKESGDFIEEGQECTDEMGVRLDNISQRSNLGLKNYPQRVNLKSPSNVGENIWKKKMEYCSTC
jgi:hypothetical protein